MAETNTRDGENHASNRARKPNDNQTETIETIASRDGHRDKAAELLRAAGHSVVVTPEENQRILRMIDWHILPIILAIYCLQSLDKTALSYASVFGLVEDLHLVGNQYSWSAAIVYVAQLVWQPLVAYFLVKLPLAKFCAIMVFCWGATLCGMVRKATAQRHTPLSRCLSLSLRSCGICCPDRRGSSAEIRET